jgi:hypothetical protein
MFMVVVVINILIGAFFVARGLWACAGRLQDRLRDEYYYAHLDPKPGEVIYIPPGIEHIAVGPQNFSKTMCHPADYRFFTNGPKPFNPQSIAASRCGPYCPRCGKPAMLPEPEPKEICSDPYLVAAVRAAGGSIEISDLDRYYNAGIQYIHVRRDRVRNLTILSA